MSRIGKQPITVPAGVDVTIDGNTVTVKGPKGELTRSFPEIMIIKREGDDIIVERPDDSRDAKAFHGLVRTLALPDAPVITGTSSEVFAHYGLDAAGIAASATELLARAEA